MDKFEIGQRVRVRQWDDMVAEFGLDEDGDIQAHVRKAWFVADMKLMCGKTFVVTQIDAEGEFFEVLCGWTLSPWMCEPAEKIELQEHHGVDVWTNTETDSLRRTECLCLQCEEMGQCDSAKRLYDECVSGNLALMVTRCPKFEAKKKG